MQGSLSPYINRFLSADTIVPGYINPQNLNRYSYVLNNPIKLNDPTGHKACIQDNSGGCDKKEELWNYAIDIVGKLGRKNDLKAMTQIVRKAASLFKTFDTMIPALSGIFLGIEESNPATILHGKNADPCAAVGRSECAASAVIGTFGDKGFHKDFQDGFNQPFHFWAYLATAANTKGAGHPGGYLAGQIMGNAANIFHEMIRPDGAGATWQDYALARAGMNIGAMVNNSQVSPGQLANTIEDYVGTDGPGAFYVNPLIATVPLQGNR